MSVICGPLGSAELARIPAAPESSLPPGVHEKLPPSAPLAPWHCRFDGLVWIQRAGAGAASVLPDPLRRSASVRWVIGALMRYTESPVGPYSEVYAAVVVRRGLRVVAHIPFMAVDSLESIRGGRANWALPKTLASFKGSPSTSDATRAAGEGWEVNARGRPFGPAVPTRMASTCAQVRPDGSLGTFKVAVAGSSRLARVTVEVTSEGSLATFMPPGRHVGTRWSDASLHVAAPVRHGSPPA